MKRLELSDEMVGKLDRAVFLRLADDNADAHNVNETADERKALTVELASMFGPLVKQLVDAEILIVDVGESPSFSDPIAPVKRVYVDDEFGIIMDVS